MKHFAKTLCAAALCSFVGYAYAANTNTTTITMNANERNQIEEVVRQYLIRKPEIIVEALQTMQRKQYEEAQKTVKKTQTDATKYAEQLFHQANDPVAGNPNGKVTVVEFFDYQCSHCIDMAPVIDAAIKASPDTRVVFKEFPIRGPMSELASRAALAANKQGKYYEFHQALLGINKPLTETVIFETAKNSGLDVEKLKTDMNDSSINAQLKAIMSLGEQLKLFGTPAFFIASTNVSNNKGTVSYIPGALNQQQLQAEIQKASK